MLKLRQFTQYRPFVLAKWTLTDFLIALEVAVTLAIMRFLVLILPFRRIAGLVGTIVQKSPEDGPLLSSAQDLRIKQIERMLPRISYYVPWRSKCMEQSLSGMLLLKRRGIPSTIHFGVAKQAAEMKAHAWLRCGYRILTGAKGRERFTVVFCVRSK